MIPKALVIDDDPHILDSVGDILKSLRHEYDQADSVESARQLLECGEYTYVLLDLEIPVYAGKSFPRVQDGLNLLKEIIANRGLGRTPVVIVMTSHGTDGPELAVDVMQLGAFSYVAKPFKLFGDKTLDSHILKALAWLEEQNVASQICSASESDNATQLDKSLRPFTGGEIAFFSNRVELCGVVVCDDGSRSKLRRALLDLLRVRRKDGSFEFYSGNALADAMNHSSGADGIAGLVRQTRTRIALLLQKAGIACGEHDVILTTDHGYCFSDKLTVQFAASPDLGQDAASPGDDVPKDHVSDVANADVANADVANAKVAAGIRREWIIQRIEERHRLRTPEIVKQFHCDRRTALRDLNDLIDEGEVERIGKKKSAFYQRKRPTPEA